MKLATSETRTIDTNMAPLGPMQIKATPMAYQILSSRIYSKKEESILRELCCNALDGHVAGGCADRPFEVKLPNQLDREFYVKDFGIGLSHEEVISLYTTYFASNKLERDDQVGAFGLGSKSPLAYTDSFSVIAAKDGVENSYMVFFREDGMPVPALVHTQPASADFPHGVKVSFPVQPEDFKKFENAARRVLPWFDVAPDIKGAAPTLIQKPEKQTSHEGFGVYALGNNNSCEGPFVKMGPVLYPLDLTPLGRQHVDRLNYLAAFLTGVKDSSANHWTMSKEPLSFVLNVDIGAVSVATSREMLEYTKPTVLRLQHEIDDLWRTLLAKESQQAASLLQAWSWENIKTFGGTLRRLKRYLEYAVDLLDPLLREEKRIPLVTAVARLNVTAQGAVMFRPGYRGDIRICPPVTDAWTNKKSFDLATMAKDNTVWIADDLHLAKSRQLTRSEALRQDTPAILVDNATAEGQALLAAAGNPPLVPVSSLSPLLPKKGNRSAVAKQPAVTTYKVDCWEHHRWSGRWAPKEINISDDLSSACYVQKDEPTGSSAHARYRLAGTAYPLLSALHLKDPLILFVSKRQKDKVVQQGAMTYEDLVAKTVLRLQHQATIAKQPVRLVLVGTILDRLCLVENHELRLKPGTIRLLDHLSSTDLADRLQNFFCNNALAFSMTQTQVDDLTQLLGGQLPAQWQLSSVLEKELRFKYPMALQVLDWHARINSDDVANQICEDPVLLADLQAYLAQRNLEKEASL